MASWEEAPLARSAVVSSAVLALVVVHVLMRYLMALLHGFATYRGFPQAITLTVFFGYAVLLAGVAVATVRHRAWPGLVLGTGLLVLAIEPYTSTMRWGDGCEVAGGASLSLLPEVTVTLGAVRLGAWNGACTASVNIVFVSVAVLWIAVGLWLSTLPATAYDRVVS